MTLTTAHAPLRGALLTAALFGVSCENTPDAALRLASLDLDIGVSGIASASARICGVQMSPSPARSCMSDLRERDMTGDCPCFNTLDEISIDGLCPTSQGGGGEWHFDYTLYIQPDCPEGSAITGSGNPNNFVCYDSTQLAAMSDPNASIEALAVGRNVNHIVCTTQNARKLWAFEDCKVWGAQEWVGTPPSPAAPGYAARYDCGCVPSGGACNCESGIELSDLGPECKFESNTCDIVCGHTCTTAAQCDDGLACTADQCVDGICANTSTCNDNDNQCTLDICTPNGCVYSPVDDGRPCGVPEVGGYCLLARCAFPCDDKIYIITINPTVGTGGGSTLGFLEPGGTLFEVRHVPDVLNGLGMDDATGIMYAIQETEAQTGRPGGGELWEIRADGSFIKHPTPIFTAADRNLNWWGGTFLQDGRYVVISADSNPLADGLAATAKLAFIDVATNTLLAQRTINQVSASVLLVPVTGYPVIWDIAQHPTTLQLWGFNQLFTPVPLTPIYRGFGSMTIIGTSGNVTFTLRSNQGSPAFGSYAIIGAMAFDPTPSGLMYIYGTERSPSALALGAPQTELYMFNFATNAISHVLSGPVVEHSDAAMCTFPQNRPPRPSL